MIYPFEHGFMLTSPQAFLPTLKLRVLMTRNVIPVIEISAGGRAKNYRGGGGGGLPGGGGGGVKLDGAGAVPLPLCAGGPPLILPDTGTRWPLAYMH